MHGFLKDTKSYVGRENYKFIKLYLERDKTNMYINPVQIKG